MDFMTWAHNVASAHPQLQDAIVTTNDEWLDILLADGRSFRFRPGALIRQDSPESTRTDILNRLLTIGIEQAVPPATPTNTPETSPHPSLMNTDHGTDTLPLAPEPDDDVDDGEPRLLPIVDAAPFFLHSHHDGDSIVYLPLTDFIAVGLVNDTKNYERPVYYSHLADSMRDVGEVMSEAVMNLRSFTGEERHMIEMGVATIGNGQVMSFMKPEGYQLSWWCDVEMMHKISEHITADRPGDIPLFIPISRTQFYIVFADDPHLIDVVNALLETSDTSTMVYPLPHTLAADGWREWVPFPGDELSQALSQLRTQYRQAIYNAQVDLMNRWGDFGSLKSYRITHIPTGESVGLATWDATDGHGSVPDTDMITFTRQASPHPWEDAPELSITLRSHVAREIWSDGFERDPDAWPPRWNIAGFPDADTIEQLRRATDREF
ncbi:hypothetical protein [Arcanobacterium phocae]|uniref:hypothetical protein n=1 Tax=Arcanobacterium phocae TaxID=131112 RepID=UPI001C0F3648|nr:hypothetical protein [Arcanobacterium phocae]